MKPNRPLAILAALIFGILMFLYVHEFSVFSNTLEVKRLVFISILAGVVIGGGILWAVRARFKPLEENFPSVVFILIFCIVFAPLFGSLLNRGLGSDGTDSFEFVSETAFFAAGYGVLQGEKLKPTGWKLILKEGKQEWRLSYKTQAYYPVTKPGETVLLPVRRGIFGVRVVELK